jgi:hypothetical protein
MWWAKKKKKNKLYLMISKLKVKIMMQKSDKFQSNDFQQMKDNNFLTKINVFLP